MPEKSSVARENCEIDILPGTRINQYFASVPKIAEIAETNWNRKPHRESKLVTNKKQFTKIPPGCILKY